MQTYCFFFLDPVLVEGVADLPDPEARRDALLEITEDERVTAWEGLRIRGPELNRTITAIARIFGFGDDELGLSLLGGAFPGLVPQHAPTFCYVDPATTRRLAERLVAAPEQDEKLDEDPEVARVYSAVFDALDEAARRGRAVVIFVNG